MDMDTGLETDMEKFIKKGKVPCKWASGAEGKFPKALDQDGGLRPSQVI